MMKPHLGNNDSYQALAAECERCEAFINRDRRTALLRGPSPGLCLETIEGRQMLDRRIGLLPAVDF
jgi:hypothetical protein